jgi:hypothetical protein
MASSRRRALAGAVVVAALGLAGCGGGGGAADSATASTSTATATSDAPTSESTTTTTAAPTEEEAILAAYQGYWDTWLAANDPPNPDHPDLAKYATGAALENVRSSIAEYRALGQVVRLPAESRYASDATVVGRSLDEATVSDCAADDSQLIDEATGVILDGSEGTFEFEATLRRGDVGWQVALVEQVRLLEGIVPCGE